MATSYAFIDRDGTLIFEPPDTFQIDSLEKLKILPGVIEALSALLSKGYHLILVSNQDGRGTPAFPEENFQAAHQAMLDIFRKNDIAFEEQFICPHFPADHCLCRKPVLGIFGDWLENADIDREKSFVLGDRDTDMQMAKNLGIRGIKVPTNIGFMIQDLFSNPLL